MPIDRKDWAQRFPEFLVEAETLLAKSEECLNHLQLISKDKDAIKEKFRLFNASFDDLIAKHKALSMEREVREILARQVQSLIEPLYNRFWDRYHEVDKGKGKHVKYDKAAISKIFASLG